MSGIHGFGTYVPYWRLRRGAITEALGAGGGKGTRAVAGYDEDATSMAVEAARALHRSLGELDAHTLTFATAAPPYADKTNATTIHAALALDREVAAFDAVGSVRSSVGALLAGLRSSGRTLVATSDVRTGLPGGADEASGGDAAVALLVGEGPGLAELIGTGSASMEFLDRWRVPGASASKQWEERFGEQAYLPLAEAAVARACDEAGVKREQVDHVVLAGLQARTLRSVSRSLGVGKEAFGTDTASTLGNVGAAQLALGLADALERAEPDQTILALSLADGADALVFRTTAGVTGVASDRTVADHAADPGGDVAYATFLTWRGMLDREPPRRPDPERPAAPPSLRSEGWKFAFIGSRCERCGTRHLPPQRVCVNCGAVDEMTTERLADTPATIATYTVDRLAFSLSPPVVAAVVDFDGGSRFTCELTDVDPEQVAIGDRVEMTFRRMFTADGVHNYFWKARPLTREA